MSNGIDWLCDRFKVAMVGHDAGEIGGPVRQSGSPEPTERAVSRPFRRGLMASTRGL